MIDLVRLRLSVGVHAEGSREMCVMEAAARLAGEAWTDRPVSVSPVLTALLTCLNDAMDDVQRQDLKRLIPILPGTRGEGGVEVVRSWMVLDWHCRTWPSAWLRAIGCTAVEAAPITDIESLRAALWTLHRASKAAAARREATRLGAFEQRSAGDEATYRLAVAYGKAQVDAVRAMSATSAWSAGWDLSRVYGPQAWDAARDHARSIGRDAALVCAWNACLEGPLTKLRSSMLALVRSLIEARQHVHG